MMSLEDEISHLQKENSRIETQLSRMKGEVSSAEADAGSDDRVNLFARNLSNLNRKFCRIRTN